MEGTISNVGAVQIVVTYILVDFAVRQALVMVEIADVAASGELLGLCVKNVIFFPTSLSSREDCMSRHNWRLIAAREIFNVEV